MTWAIGSGDDPDSRLTSPTARRLPSFNSLAAASTSWFGGADRGRRRCDDGLAGRRGGAGGVRLRRALCRTGGIRLSERRGPGNASPARPQHPPSRAAAGDRRAVDRAQPPREGGPPRPGLEGAPRRFHGAPGRWACRLGSVGRLPNSSPGSRPDQGAEDLFPRDRQRAPGRSRHGRRPGKRLEGAGPPRLRFSPCGRRLAAARRAQPPGDLPAGARLLEFEPTRQRGDRAPARDRAPPEAGQFSAVAGLRAFGLGRLVRLRAEHERATAASVGRRHGPGAGRIVLSLPAISFEIAITTLAITGCRPACIRRICAAPTGVWRAPRSPPTASTRRCSATAPPGCGPGIIRTGR